MKSTCLTNKFFNTKSDTDRNAINKQRNLCGSHNHVHNILRRFNG